MNRIESFKKKRQNNVLSSAEKQSIKGGLREFLKKGTGNPVNHARYRKARRQAESIMLVHLADGDYFCIDW